MATDYENYRGNIIEDIIRCWYEGNPTTEKDEYEYRQELKELSDEDLLDEWRSTVGEWICSRDDILDNDESVDLQLNKILNKVMEGDEQPHGYVV
jgi:hypothetical protein